MHKLIQYHSTKANLAYYTENMQVAIKLVNNKLNSYKEYKKACEEAGCNCYLEILFNDYIKSTENVF